MSAFIGKGIVYAAQVNPTTGAILGPWLDLGEVDNFEPGGEVQSLEKRTSRDTSNALIAYVETQLNSSINLTLVEPSIDNLRLIVRGEKIADAGAAVTDEPLQDPDDPDRVDIINDEILMTKYPIAGVITNVKDSAGSPATVTNTKYERVDDSSFAIRFTDVAGYTQPFTVSYTKQASTIVKVFEATLTNYRIRIENIDLVSADVQMVEYYNVRLSPAARFGLITEEFASFQLEGRALAVPGFAADPDLGKYGRVIRGYVYDPT